MKACVRLLTMPLFVILSTSQVCFAKLARTKFSELAKESSLIVHATPIKSEWTDNGAGFAVLRVNTALKGKIEQSELTIKWRSEVHDQPISDMSVDWVLFLKKNSTGDQYEATHYGRSYWPLNSRTMRAGVEISTSPDVGILYQYPLTMAQLTKTEKGALIKRGKKANSDDNQGFIPLEQLIRHLSSINKSKNKL